MKALITFALLSFCAFAFLQNIKPWMNKQDSPAERAQKLLAEMNLTEKFTMIHGWPGPYAGTVPENTRLGIPALHLEDGPQGVADGVKNVTCWPSALAVTASWDTELMYTFAKNAAKEEAIKGTNVMLGPMMNIARNPVGGRNFESMGEDPYLAGEMAYSYIQGVQSEGVIACAKHFALNNQELNRTLTSANADERTIYEIYFPQFKRSVEAGVGSVMCSYNRINDIYACENFDTLTQGLKRYMNFSGWVMSDWGATHSSSYAANNGLDQEMPSDDFFGQKLMDDYTQGRITIDRINDMVLRILTPMFQMGLFDRPQTGDLNVDARSEERSKLSRKLSAAATVLLQNDDNILPLDSKKIKKIAVLGDDGHDAPRVAGGGSGQVQFSYVVSPLDGIKKRAGSNIEVVYSNTTQLSQAVQQAQEADVAIVFLDAYSSEGSDRQSLSLGSDQDTLVSKVASVNRNTIVVVHSPGAALMPWVDDVKAILCAFMPGQETGNAIADILFGDVNPSARLPVTFPVSDQAVPCNTTNMYPGINNDANYSEGLLVGYRYYDALNIRPLFEFGYGMSYSEFSYNNLKVSGSNYNVNISIEVRNLGPYDGADVIQLYLSYPSYANEPPKQLKGFKKIFLKDHERQTITFSLNWESFSTWDANSHSQQPKQGDYIFMVGGSSRTVQATKKCNIDGINVNCYDQVSLE